MIRTTRLCLLGKKYSSIPIFTQRAVTLPKQTCAEFCTVTDKSEDEKSRLQQSEQISSQFTSLSKQVPKQFIESYKEIKYTFLRDILNGSNLNKKGIISKDFALKDFFDTLPRFAPSEVIRVLKLIAETNNRPLESLRALCGLLISHKGWQYSSKECADALYSLAKLSYKEEEVIQIFVNNLKNYEEFHSAKAASCILHSLGDLRHRDCELIEKLLKYILSGVSTPKSTLRCLRAVTLLNYSSEEVDKLIQMLESLRETDFTQSTDYINFIWSCVVLNKHHLIDPEHIATILSEKSVTRLLNGGVHPPIKWKLLNINGAARQMPSYKGPLLNNLACYKIMCLSIPNQRNPFLESVLDVLSHIAGQNGRVVPLINTGAGFYLDFEFLEEDGKSPEWGTEESGNSKLGILLLNFNDICSDDTMTGMSAYKLNILQGMGYRTVVLRHSEYNHSDSLSKKIKFLREKITLSEFAPLKSEIQGGNGNVKVVGSNQK